MFTPTRAASILFSNPQPVVLQTKNWGGGCYAVTLPLRSIVTANSLKIKGSYAVTLSRVRALREDEGRGVSASRARANRNTVTSLRGIEIYIGFSMAYGCYAGCYAGVTLRNRVALAAGVIGAKSLKTIKKGVFNG